MDFSKLQLAHDAVFIRDYIINIYDDDVFSLQFFDGLTLSSWHELNTLWLYLATDGQTCLYFFTGTLNVCTLMYNFYLKLILSGGL